MDAAGPVLGLPSSRVAQPGETLCAPWLVALVRTPRDWASVEDVATEPDDLLLRNGQQTLRITATGVQAFLDGAKEER